MYTTPPLGFNLRFLSERDSSNESFVIRLKKFSSKGQSSWEIVSALQYTWGAHDALSAPLWRLNSHAHFFHFMVTVLNPCNYCKGRLQKSTQILRLQTSSTHNSQQTPSGTTPSQSLLLWWSLVVFQTTFRITASNMASLMISHLMSWPSMVPL